MKISLITAFGVIAIFQCVAQLPSTHFPTPSRIGLIFSVIINEKEITAAINCPERRTPTQFLKLGDAIPHTEYKIIGFISKTKPPMFILERQDKKFAVEIGRLVWIDL